ncbi:MAG: hypothetical protein ACO2ER_15985, partial [Castellaniella sp.]
MLIFLLKGVEIVDRVLVAGDQTRHFLHKKFVGFLGIAFLLILDGGLALACVVFACLQHLPEQSYGLWCLDERADFVLQGGCLLYTSD